MKMDKENILYVISLEGAVDAIKIVFEKEYELDVMPVEISIDGKTFYGFEMSYFD